MPQAEDGNERLISFFKTGAFNFSLACLLTIMRAFFICRLKLELLCSYCIVHNFIFMNNEGY